jgi:hypothetical protein
MIRVRFSSPRWLALRPSPAHHPSLLFQSQFQINATHGWHTLLTPFTLLTALIFSVRFNAKPIASNEHSISLTIYK